VPFGEYLPFQDFWRLFGISQFVPGTEGWAPGDGRRLMTVPGTPAFIALICYEAIFSGDLGADPADAGFILNITNDAWFDGSIGPAQHAHHARLRAVETGLPLVRAGNTGVTLLTDPLGRVVAHLEPGAMGVLDVVPALKLSGTTFNRIGMWPFWIAILAGLHRPPQSAQGLSAGAVAARPRAVRDAGTTFSSAPGKHIKLSLYPH
jgi:apolipoprotein N-acyltransferase